MISRPAMVPAVRLVQPQVRFPADSNGEPHAMQRRTLMMMGDRLASLRATFFCSISLTTLGGSVLILGADSPTPSAPSAPRPVRVWVFSVVDSSCEERFVVWRFSMIHLPFARVQKMMELNRFHRVLQALGHGLISGRFSEKADITELKKRPSRSTVQFHGICTEKGYRW